MGALFQFKAVFATPTAVNGTVTVAYPAGQTQADFQTHTSNQILLGEAVYSQISGQFSAVFGASTITITNTSGETWPAGRVTISIGSVARRGSYALALGTAIGTAKRGDLASGPVALAISGTPAAATVGDNPTFAPTIVGGTAPYTLSLLSGSLPGGRTVNGAANTVTGAYTTAGTFNYVLRATDSVAATADLPVSLVVSVAGAALAISGTPGPATVGTPYSFTPATTGGSGTKSFSMSGSLPAGLSFSSVTGAITGTPTTAATTSGIGITVTDASGSATLSGLAIVVGAASPALSLAGTPPGGTIGTAYPGFTPTPSGGSGAYSSYSASGLPAGLSQDATTGLVSGTPTGAAGTSTPTFTVTDSLGATASYTPSIEIAASGTGPTPPTGFIYLIDSDNAYFTDADGARLMEAA